MANAGATRAAEAAPKKLKVFIMAGQSNMEGHAEIRTFDSIGKDPLTAPLLEEMRNPDGTPRVCDKVWMSYLTGPYDGSANGEGLPSAQCRAMIPRVFERAEASHLHLVGGRPAVWLHRPQ